MPRNITIGPVYDGCRTSRYGPPSTTRWSSAIWRSRVEVRAERADRPEAERDAGDPDGAAEPDPRPRRPGQRRRPGRTSRPARRARALRAATPGAAGSVPSTEPRAAVAAEAAVLDEHRPDERPEHERRRRDVVDDERRRHGRQLRSDRSAAIASSARSTRHEDVVVVVAREHVRRDARPRPSRAANAAVNPTASHDECTVSVKPRGLEDERQRRPRARPRARARRSVPRARAPRRASRPAARRRGDVATTNTPGSRTTSRARQDHAEIALAAHGNPDVLSGRGRARRASRARSPRRRP